MKNFLRLVKFLLLLQKNGLNKEDLIQTEECIAKLKEEGFKIYGSILSDKAEDIYNIDFTEKVAIVMGNEHRGISDEIIENVDKHIYIPMRGMIQSLNVSVATAVILYEAQRQRSIKGIV